MSFKEPKLKPIIQVLIVVGFVVIMYLAIYFATDYKYKACESEGYHYTINSGIATEPGYIPCVNQSYENHILKTNVVVIKLKED